jgi:glycosyltransferase involved in cell wall biosynthesis
VPAPARRVLLVSDQPPQGGLGRYARALYHALLDADRPDLGIDLLLQNVAGRRPASDWSSPSPRAVESAILQHPRPRWAKPTGYGKAYQFTSLWYFPRRVPRGYALYHVTSPLMGATVRRVAPCVVTVHDVIPARLPGNAGWLRTLVRRRHLRAVPAAQGLIFDSAHARQEFLSFYEYPVERTAVVPLAAGDGFVPGDRAAAREALGLPAAGPILLHVGAEEPRKNIGTLLEAVRLLRARYPDVLLLRVGPMRSRTRRRVARLGLGEHVRYRGGVSEADLVRHYQAADAFVFPSVYEGFGLPVLEALACGCPVVAGDATSVPEITGAAALLVDPRDADAFARAIGRVLEDSSLAGALRAGGPVRAAAFSWERVARETLAAYRRASGVA